jgi:DNA invertase Pin-like site-specific DNA recombinase
VDLRNREVRFAATHNELKLDTTPRPVSAMCGRLRVGKDFLHVRGASTAGRAELQTVLDFLRKGDCLMVTRIDRLARSIGDLQDIVRSVKAKGATLKATEQPFDTGNIYGELTVNLLGLFR